MKFDKYKPMLLKEVDKPFDSEEYIFEPKYDGIRALIFVSKNEVVIKSRNGKVLNSLFPELDSIKNICSGDVVFDGEIVLFDGDVPSFSALQERLMLRNKKRIDFMSRTNPVIFVCFDILYEGKDLAGKKLFERKEILNKYKDRFGFVKTMYVKGRGVKLFDSIKSMGLEGIVAKRIDSEYLVGERSSEWVKIKNLISSEVYIGGYFDNEKSYMATLVVGEKREGKFFYSAKVTISKKSEEYKIIKSEKKIKSSPFLDFSSSEFVYVFPRLKCEVSYLEKTSNGYMRHAIYKGLVK